METADQVKTNINRYYIMNNDSQLCFCLQILKQQIDTHFFALQRNCYLIMIFFQQYLLKNCSQVVSSQNYLHFQNKMVKKNLLGSLDRLSVQSVWTDKTNSFCGLIGTLCFILFSFLLFIVLLIQYFDGDYFQSSLALINPVPSQFSTGTDFRAALVFRNKITNEVANHNVLLTSLESTFQLNVNGSNYYSSMLPCDPNYFAGAINEVPLTDCIVIPPNLLFDMYGNVKISIKKKCLKPFQCLSGSAEQNTTLSTLVNLLKDNYYTIYFTSKVINQQGKPQFEVHESYSSEFYKVGGLTTGVLLIQYNLRTNYVDNSILPWRSNQTSKTMVWPGNIRGFSATESSFTAGSLVVQFQYKGYQEVAFRYYKKLDWMLGCLGGGILVLYFICLIICGCINTYFSRSRIPSKFILQSNIAQVQSFNAIQKSKMSWKYSLSWPFSNCLKTQDHALIEQANQKLNIIRIIKKMKVIVRNLKISLGEMIYSPTKLILEQQQQQQQNQIQQRQASIQSNKLQLHDSIVNELKGVPQQYQKNLTVLVLAEKTQNLTQIQDMQKNSKTKSYLKDKNCLQMFLGWFGDCIRFFDIFAAKPSLIMQPYNRSCFSFLIVIIITIISMLIISVTISNMNKPQYVIEEDKVTNNMVRMTTGSTFKMVNCWSTNAINTYILGVSGAKRVLMQYFLTTKNSSGTFTKTYDPLTISNTSFYMQNIVNDRCLKIPDNLEIMTGTNGPTDSQFGLIIKPFCYGTPSECANKTATTRADFFALLNNFAGTLFTSENAFDTQTQAFTRDYGISNTFLESLQVGNYSDTIEQTLYYDTTALLDDSKAWFFRQPPSLIRSVLSVNENFRNEVPTTINTTQLYYKLTLRPTGKIKKIILRSNQIDFLLGTIGGVFTFFYAVLSWIGKIFNSFKVKSKIAQILYQQNLHRMHVWQIAFYLFRVPLGIIPQCCGRNNVKRIRQVINKIQNQLMAIELAKNIDTTWKLSSNLFQRQQERYLSSIYLKEPIDDKQKVDEINYNSNNLYEPSEQPNQFLPNELNQEQFSPPKKKSGIVDSSEVQPEFKIQSSFENLEMNNEEKQQMFKQENFDRQPLTYKHLYREKKSFWDTLKKLDLFSIQPEFNLNNKFSVKSISGGCCFFIFAIIIVIIAVHFVGLYLRNESYNIGTRTYATSQTKDSIIELIVGQNFKFMYSFYKRSKYYFNSLIDFPTLGIKAYQLIVNRLGNITVEKIIDFVPCSDEYLQSWVGDYMNPTYYQSLKNGLCLPDGTKLTIKGSPNDPQYKYFYFSIQNTDPTANITKFNTFFNTFLVNYHFSKPVQNYKLGKIKYEMVSLREDNFLRNLALDYNMSLSKFKLIVQGGDFPTPPQGLQTYDFIDYHSRERIEQYTLVNQTMWKNLTFNYNNIVRQYKVQYTKFGQIIGMVGGVSVFFICGIGCLVSSFNQYRMKYIAAKEIYYFKRQYKLPKNGKEVKNKEQKLIQKAVSFELNEFQIWICWFLSFFCHIASNYNFTNNLRMITLLIERIEDDLSIYAILKTLRGAEKKINSIKKLPNVEIPISKVYIKQIVNLKKLTKSNTIHFKQVAQLNKLTAYQQHLMDKVHQMAESDKYFYRIFGQNKLLDKNLIRMRVQRRNNSQLERINRTNNLGNSSSFIEEPLNQEPNSLNQAIRNSAENSQVINNNNLQNRE